MATRSPSPERLDDILVEDSYADLEQEPSPRAMSDAEDKEASSLFQPAAGDPEASTSQTAAAAAASAKPVRQRIPVGPLEDFKSAPKRQPVPQVAQASARPQQQVDRGGRLPVHQNQQQLQPQLPQQPAQQSGATRYFLLKSVSIENIERSVEEGIWATQKHNEEKLNKAYETSEAVHLIFSVNSSGFFQGWARMTSRITVGQRDRNEWRGRLAVGGSFEVEWLRRYDLVMRSCDHLTNPWNENKPVRIARDGQEMPASIGKQLVDAIELAAEQDNVVRPPKPQRRPPPEPPRRPPSGPANGHRRPPGPMNMNPMGQGSMMGMAPPFAMMPPSQGPPMFGGSFGPMGGPLPPGRNNGPMGAGPMRVAGGGFERPPGAGPPQPPPRPPRDSFRDNGPGPGPAGRGADWARGPELIGDSLSGFDDDQPFEDQAPGRAREVLNNGGSTRSLLMGARDAMPVDQLVGIPDRAGQTSASSRRMPSGGLPEYSSMPRAKRERSASRSPSPRRRSRSRRRTRSRSDSRSPSPARNGDRALLDMTYEDYLANFKKAREKSEREASQGRNQMKAPSVPAQPPMSGMMGGFMPGMMPGMMGAPGMMSNPLMMSMMMSGGAMNPFMMGMNPMAGMGNGMPGMPPMGGMGGMGMGAPMGMGGGMGGMPGDISEDDYLRVWRQYSASNNQPFNANHYRQMYRQFKGH